MSNYKNILLVPIVLLLSACVGMPSIDHISTRTIKRIGILVDVGDTPMHSHSAAAPFASDSHRVYPFDWGLNEKAKTDLSRDLEATTKTEIVDLAEHGLSKTDLNQLIVYANDKWINSPLGRETIKKLHEELNIDAVVLLRSGGGVSNITNCLPNGYCDSTNNIGMGLYTSRGPFGILLYNAVLNVRSSIFLLNENVDLGYYGELARLNRLGMKQISGYSTPANIKAITENEWLPVRNTVNEMMEDLINATIAQILNPQRAAIYPVLSVE